MNTMMTLHDFVRTRSIWLASKPIDTRPDQEPDAKWEADHWKCTLSMSRGGAVLRKVVYYSKGKGHKGKAPTTEEVLDSLALDSSALDQSFEDWCSDFGMSSDSRSAERTYKQCRKHAAQLKMFLGPEDFKVLIEQCERL